MLKLKKFAIKLEKEQVYEPVDTLFIIRKRGTHLYRCFGYGELRERFINGKVLTDYPPYSNRKEQSMPEVEKDTQVEFLTPEKDPFSFSRGSGKTLAERQKEKLDNLPIMIAPDEVNVEKPGPAKTQRLKKLFERPTIGHVGRGGRGRGTGGAKGRGRGRKRKPESSSDSDKEESDDDNEEEIRPTIGHVGRGGRGRVSGGTIGRGIKRKQESSSDSDKEESDDDNEEEIRPITKKPRKQLFINEFSSVSCKHTSTVSLSVPTERIEDSHDEEDLSPLLPLDSSLLSEATILITESSFNIEHVEEDQNKEELDENNKEERDENNKEERDENNKEERDENNKEELDEKNKEKLDENNKEELDEKKKEERDENNKEERDEKKKEERDENNKEELDENNKEERDENNKEELDENNKEELDEKKKEELDEKKKDELCIGDHIKVTNGNLDFPAIVTDIDDSGIWGQFFRRKGSSWALDEIKYFIMEKDIIKTLQPPDLVQLGGSRFSYKFIEF